MANEIPFDQLVEALKGKGPGDFISSAFGGVKTGMDTSFERRKQEFLNKVKQTELQEQQRKNIFDVNNKTNEDLIAIAKGQVGTEQRDPSTNKVIATTPPQLGANKDVLVQNAWDARNKYFGLNDPTPVIKSETGTKPPPGGGGTAADKADTAKRLSILWESVKPDMKVLNDDNTNWWNNKGTVISEFLTLNTPNAVALRNYNDAKPAAAVGIYRLTTNDTRLSDTDAAARALPLLPKYGIDSPATVNAKSRRIEQLLQNPSEAAFEFAVQEAKADEMKDAEERSKRGMSAGGSDTTGVNTTEEKPAWKNYRTPKGGK